MKNPGGSKLLNAKTILEKADIQEKQTVADLGCGSTGLFVFKMADMVGEKGLVYAVDILKPMLDVVDRRARQGGYTNIESVWSNMEIYQATKIEASSLDAALLVNILYQSEKRAEVIREAVRMLKQNSKLIIAEWDKASSYFGPPAEERVKKDKIISGAQKLGLKYEEEFVAGDYHYGLVFTKL